MMDEKATLEAIGRKVQENEAHHVSLLREGLKASLVGRDDFQRWFARELERVGLEVQMFEVDPDELNVDRKEYLETIMVTAEILRNAG